jgi:hypothetical protein
MAWACSTPRNGLEIRTGFRSGNPNGVTCFWRPRRAWEISTDVTVEHKEVGWDVWTWYIWPWRGSLAGFLECLLRNRREIVDWLSPLVSQQQDSPTYG